MTGSVEKVDIENLRGKLVTGAGMRYSWDKIGFCMILFATYDWDSRNPGEPYLIKYLDPTGQVLKVHISGDALDALEVF